MELETWVFCYDFVHIEGTTVSYFTASDVARVRVPACSAVTRVEGLVCTERDLPDPRAFLASGTFSWSMHLLPMLWML